MYAIVKIYDDNNQMINDGRIEPCSVHEQGINITAEFRFTLCQVNEEKLREELKNCNKEAKDEL